MSYFYCISRFNPNLYADGKVIVFFYVYERKFYFSRFLPIFFFFFLNMTLYAGLFEFTWNMAWWRCQREVGPKEIITLPGLCLLETSSCMLEPSDTTLLTITEEVIKPNSVLCRIVIEKKRYKTI